MEKDNLSAKELKRKIGAKEKLIILDVRDEEKFLAGTLEDGDAKAAHAPYAQMASEEAMREIARSCEGALIVTVCTTGGKAEKAAALLREKGLNAAVLEGGLTAWKELQEK